MLKRPWMVAGGILVATILVGATITGASHLTQAQKKALLAEKRSEFNELKAKYLELAKQNDENAYVFGNQAKDLAPVVGQLQSEVEGITNERLQILITTTKAALNDGISWGKRAGFPERYIDTIEQYLREVETLEQEFLQHSRSNEEIKAALDELSNKWQPIIDKIYKEETGQL